MGFGWLAMPQAYIANRSIDGSTGVLQITLAFVRLGIYAIRGFF